MFLPLLVDGLADDGLAEDGLAEEGLPNVTDCILLRLVDIIPLLIISGSYVIGPTHDTERDRLSEEEALPNVMLADPLLVAANPCLINCGH